MHWFHHVSLHKSAWHHLRLHDHVMEQGAAISACEGHWQEALGILMFMLGSRIHPNEVSLGAALVACEKAGPFKEQNCGVWRLWWWKGQTELNAEAGRWQVALSLLVDLAHCDVKLNTAVYNAAVLTCRGLGVVAGFWNRWVAVV